MTTRRALITMLGGAAAWPLAARAQRSPSTAQRSGMPVVGFLSGQSPDTFEHYADAFRQGLNAVGYVEGQNVGMEYRWAKGRPEELPWLAADLVRHQVAVIAATGGIASGLAAKTATTTIPIVFTSGDDPVRSGLVTSLNRPGGNITGVSFFHAETAAKRLALLRELVPAAPVFALLVNPSNPEVQAQPADAQWAAAALNQHLIVLKAGTAGEIDAAFTALVQQRAGALVVAADPFFRNRRSQIIALSSRHAIPTIYAGRDYITAGGLISYGNSLADAYRRAAIYTGRILKGDKPGDLPVDQATKFELVVNLKTAKTLGLDLPLSILMSAEVIE